MEFLKKVWSGIRKIVGTVFSPIYLICVGVLLGIIVLLGYIFGEGDLWTTVAALASNFIVLSMSLAFAIIFPFAVVGTIRDIIDGIKSRRR